MAGYPGPGDAAQVRSHVEPVGRVDGLDGHDRLRDRRPEGPHLLAGDVLHLTYVPHGQHHHVAARVRKGIQDDGDLVVAPHHVRAIFDDLAQHAGGVVEDVPRRHVLAAPGRPDALHHRLATTSACSRSTKVSRWTSRSTSPSRGVAPAGPAGASAAPTTSTYGIFSRLGRPA